MKSPFEGEVLASCEGCVGLHESNTRGCWSAYNRTPPVVRVTRVSVNVMLILRRKATTTNDVDDDNEKVVVLTMVTTRTTVTMFSNDVILLIIILVAFDRSISNTTIYCRKDAIASIVKS